MKISAAVVNMCTCVLLLFFGSSFYFLSLFQGASKVLLICVISCNLSSISFCPYIICLFLNTHTYVSTSDKEREDTISCSLPLVCCCFCSLCWTEAADPAISWSCSISCWFCYSSFILFHTLPLWFTLYCHIAAFMIDYWLELSDTHARMRASHTWTSHDMRDPENTWVMIDFTLGFLDDGSFFCFFLLLPFSALLSRIFAFRDNFVCNWSLRLSFFNWTRIVFKLPG